MRLNAWAIFLSIFLSLVVIGASLVAFEIPGIAVAVLLLSLVALRQWKPWWGVSLLAVAAGIGIVASPFLPLRTAPLESLNRERCRERLYYIEKALECYRGTHGHYPPAYIADKNGKPMHSWRVLILPCLERAGQYEQYDFREPWNSPKNLRLAADCPSVFRCPSDSSPECETSYLAVVGPQTMWPGAKPGKGIASHGGENGILLVESCDSGVCWLEPRDLSFDEAVGNMNAESGPAIRSRHSSVVRALCSDCSVRDLPKDVPETTLAALLTAQDDPAEIEDLEWGQSSGYVVKKFLAIFVLLAAFRLLWLCSMPERKPAIATPSPETPEGP
jgi:hypothetical protein